MAPPPPGLIPLDSKQNATMLHMEEKNNEKHLAKKTEKFIVLRDALPTTAARVGRAELIKGEANAHFKAGKHELALHGYLICVWLLKAGDPPISKLLAEDAVPTGDEGLPLLGAGTDEGTAAATPDEAKLHQLRRTLHLNVAAVALKRQDWKVASAASAFVLHHGEPKSTKALFRMARAMEGQGDVERATATVQALLKIDRSNSEAKALLKSLQKQHDTQHRMFGGLFDKSTGGGGGSLYGDKQDWSEERAEKVSRKQQEQGALAEHIRQDALPGAEQPWMDELPEEERKPYEDLKRARDAGDMAGVMRAMESMRKMWDEDPELQRPEPIS